jgi:hypothetical protein
MMSKHKDPKTVMRYDHGRENMEMNATTSSGMTRSKVAITDGRQGAGQCCNN